MHFYFSTAALSSLAVSQTGCGNKGFVYESQVGGLIAIQLALDPDVEDFHIWNNIKKMGSFNDIVVLIVYKDKKKVAFGIQCKHFDNKTINIQTFEGTDKNFGLTKYQEYFCSKENKFDLSHTFLKDKGIKCDNVYLIIYTNAKMEKANKTGKSITIEPFEGCLAIPDTSNGKNVIKFTNNANSNVYNADFLSRLFIFTNQKSADALLNKIMLITEAHQIYISTPASKLLDQFFIKWIEASDPIEFDKFTIQTKLLEWTTQIYSPFTNQNQQHCFDKSELLNQIILEFNVTSIRPETLPSLKYSTLKALETAYDMSLSDASIDKMLSQDQMNLVYKRSEIKDDLKKKLQSDVIPSSQLSFQDLYYAAWKCKMVPLLLNFENKDNKNTAQIILQKLNKLSEHLSFVFVDFPISVPGNENVTTFMNAARIQPTFLNTFMNDFLISLQGKGEQSLINYINNSQILEAITPDVIVRFFNGTVMIGDAIKVKDFYIRRNLTAADFDLDMYEHCRVSDEILITTNAQPGMPFVEINLNQPLPFQFSNRTFNQNIKRAADALYEKFKKSVHVFEKQDNQRKFNWMYSVGPTAKWKNYIDMEELSEDAVSDNHSQIKIVCGTAGIGKTYHLKHLAKSCEPSEFVCFISGSKLMTNNNRNILNITNSDQLWDLVIDNQGGGIDDVTRPLAKQLLIHHNNMGIFTCFIDDIDCLPLEAAATLKTILQSTIMGKIWLSTNLNLRHSIEEQFGAICFELVPFTRHQSKSFFKSYLDLLNVDRSTILNRCTKFTGAMENAAPAFQGIPLIIKILATSGWDNDINMIELYNIFIEKELMDVYGCDLIYAKNLKDKYISLIVLNKLVGIDFVELGLEDWNQIIDEYRKIHRKNLVIKSINDNDVNLGHKSYAEFLAAQYIARKIEKTKNDKYNKWHQVMLKLLKREMMPLRKFFDAVVANNCPLHMAVISGDIQRVQSFLIKNKPKSFLKDPLGRSALHLAASYGTLLDIEKSEDNRQFSENCLLVDMKDDIQFTIFKRLVQYNFRNDKDKILNFRVPDYAIHVGNLRALNFLFGRIQKFNIFNKGVKIRLSDTLDKNLFVYNIVKYNFYNILSSSKNFNLDEMKRPEKVFEKFRDFFKNNLQLLKNTYGDRSLPEIAASQGNVEVLLLLILCGKIPINLDALTELSFGNVTKELIEEIRNL